MRLVSLALWLFRAGRRRFALAALLATLVALAGLLLMGTSGWFVAACAVAGLAGAGQVFDIFRPSAVIRVTTFGRAAARYGERLTSHDATLRALNLLRLGLFRAEAGRGLAAHQRLRSAEALNRLTADLDAVEGLLIRMVFPGLASGAALLAGGAAIWALIGPWAAMGVVAVMLAALCLLVLSAGGLSQAAAAQETALQSLRAGTAEAFRLRSLSAIEGALPGVLAQVLSQSEALEKARARIDRAERRAQAVLTLAGPLAAGPVLLAGAGPAETLGGVLIALALTEAPRLMWRGLSEAGRMRLAASRMSPAPALTIPAPMPPQGPPLIARDLVALALDGRPLNAPIALTLAPGDWVGLSAPSGRGKSSLLWGLVGLGPIQGAAKVFGLTPDQALTSGLVALVPQRPGLIGGTLAENLSLAAPKATEAQMQEALTAALLWPVVAPRGGLGMVLESQGAGLSGGEARRLAVARAILAAPGLLLLDEPTEGLDADTAKALLAGIKNALPQAAVILVSHRAEDLGAVGQIVHLGQSAPGPAPLA
ncbi:amino acid ABC transporter ATP-binding/permease protein [Stagnihabitans tardus]|uniref:ATP-binding cassette domain-containing protein n=1 Tax=Stagnihabitans tardus TaxID=2699202 RepID=A0AAE4YB93_9RHOB|nr:ATP-binding cassette domain-containing protein [Stagnihabitans tardus]NBZ89491.1 ATP-binding cassette domain-containing protein [Stagnihabitans tardus]